MYARIGLMVLCAGITLAHWPTARAADPAAAPHDLEAAAILAGTTWRLVTIQSMNDQVYTPAERDLYTLALRDEGRASLRADCNRGSGRWYSEAPGQLRFGPIASTRALCPPPSLSQKYLSQFEWVRSYVVERGRLYLATVADGAIIEFESTGAPLPGALVPGEVVTETDAEAVRERIIAALQREYAREQGIVVTTEEVDAAAAAMGDEMAAAGQPASSDPADGEMAEAPKPRRQAARELILRWKINAALYQQYGGRLAAQQLGPEPVDAWRDFLRERQAAGAFHIVDRATQRHFWRYFTEDALHEFLPAGSAAQRTAFDDPPWQR